MRRRHVPKVKRRATIKKRKHDPEARNRAPIKKTWRVPTLRRSVSEKKQQWQHPKEYEAQHALI